MSYALQILTVGIQLLSLAGNKCKAFLYSVLALLELFMLSPSAFVITTASAISIIPRFIPCSSSPAPASINSKKKSTIPCTAISDCPTPTVSISIVLYPAASHNIIVSLVFLATPPNEPLAGDGLT